MGVGEEGGSGRGKRGRGWGKGVRVKNGKEERGEGEGRRKGGEKKEVEHNNKIVVWGVPGFQTTGGWCVLASNLGFPFWI